MHSMHWWSLASVNVSALVKVLMLNWHSNVEELQEYFDVFYKREIFYELSTLLTFGRFALRCTKFNGAFIYGMEGWVLLVIKTNTLPLEYCDVVLWTWLNSGKWKQNKREKHAFINGKFPYLTFFCSLSSRRRWMESSIRVLMKEGVRVWIGLNWNSEGQMGLLSPYYLKLF